VCIDHRPHPDPRMLNIEYLIPILAFWHTISSEIHKYKETANVAHNMVNAIHCMLYIIQYNYSGTMNYAIHVSTGFYIYDLLHLLRSIYDDTAQTHRKRFIHQRTVYVIHHIIGIYLLYDTLYNDNTEIILYAYSLTEISNIMLYVSYHLHKEYPTYKRAISLSQFIQFLWYSYFRIILGSIFVYQNKDHFLQYSFVIQSCIMSLYIMSIAWSYILLKKNIANYLSLNHKPIVE